MDDSDKEAFERAGATVSILERLAVKARSSEASMYSKIISVWGEESMQYINTETDFQQELTKFLEILDKQYTLNGELIAYQELVAPNGLAPAVFHYASKWSDLENRLGVRYIQEDISLLGIKVVFNADCSWNLAGKAFFMVLHDLDQNQQATISLDSII